MAQDYGNHSVVVHFDNRDGLPFLAEVVWTRASERAFVLVCDQLSYPPLLVGYSFVDQAKLSDTEVIVPIRWGLAERYRPDERSLAPYGGNIVRWACYQHSDAHDEFRRMTGESRGLAPIIWSPPGDMPGAVSTK